MWETDDTKTKAIEDDWTTCTYFLGKVAVLKSSMYLSKIISLVVKLGEFQKLLHEFYTEENVQHPTL
jgi:hypothetical protein